MGAVDPALYVELVTLYDDCAAALDACDFERFLECFAQECVYSIHTKENVDRGWPIALVYCPTRGALVDRVTAVKKSSFIIPRTQRRLVSGVRLVSSSGESFGAEATFAVFETFEGTATSLFVTGRFQDDLRRERSCLKLARRRCILDSPIIPNSLPYPL